MKAALAVFFATLSVAVSVSAEEAYEPSLEEKLIYAAGEGELQEVDELIAAGADPSKAVNDFGETALHVAGIKANADVVRSLLAAGADVNRMTKGTYPGHDTVVTRTPLMWMVYPMKNIEGVKALLEAGAKVSPVSEEGTTALDMAKSLQGPGRAEVVKMLEEALAAETNKEAL